MYRKCVSKLFLFRENIIRKFTVTDFFLCLCVIFSQIFFLKIVHLGHFWAPIRLRRVEKIHSGKENPPKRPPLNSNEW